MRFASSPLTDHALTGQVNLFTTGSLDGVSDRRDRPTRSRRPVWPTWRSARRWADGARGPSAAPCARARSGSWFLNGTFSGRVAGAHRYSGGFAYGTQHLDARNLFGRAAIRSGSRAIGTVLRFDDWTLGPRVSVNYG